MKKQSEFTFNGFEPANTTPVPDVLFDELLSELTGAELKVLLYIIRRTSGFKKPTDAISLSQFQKGITTKEGKLLDKGCGIEDRQTIINALASLEKKNCIYGERSKTAKGDNATTVYRICFRDVVGKTYQGSMEKPTTLVEKTNHRSMEKPTTVVGDSNPQETVIQSNSLQETDKQESAYSDDVRSATSGAFAPSPAPSSQDEPYQPDFTASQAPAIRELSPVLDEAIEHVEEQRAAYRSDGSDGHTCYGPELSTLTVEKPARESAKVEPRQPRQSRKKAAPTALEFTAEGRKVYDAWCSLFKSPPRTAEKTVDCANDLYARLVPWCQELKMPCKDLLKEIKGWLYATDPDWYRRKGVTLCDIGSKFENWQSAKEESLNNPEPLPAPRTSGKSRQESKPKDSGMVEWWDQQTGAKRLMTYAEADENGWEGGFGEFIQHTHYGRTIV